MVAQAIGKALLCLDLGCIVTAQQGTQSPAAVASSADAAAPSRVTIALGQTIEQVIARLGQPKQMVDLGDRKIFIYSDMKIIFVHGKVTDVQ